LLVRAGRWLDPETDGPSRKRHDVQRARQRA
jgi:hypothetical protein